MSETPINLTTSATIIGLAKRPGMTKDGRAVFSLNVEVDGNQYELNLVTKPGQGIQQALEYLASKGSVLGLGMGWVGLRSLRDCLVVRLSIRRRMFLVVLMSALMMLCVGGT